MPPKIAVVGSLVLDHVVRVPRFPTAGETVAAAGFRTFPGGKGANQAVAAARLGAQVEMVGRIGDDAAGRVLLQALDEDGIGTEHVRVLAGEGSGAALVALDPSGENTICVALGANLSFGAEAVPRIRADAILAQLETSPEATDAAMAGESPIRILNPAPAVALSERVWSRVTVATPNEHEAAFLTGFRPDKPAACAEAARWFHERGVAHVAITLGPRGVWASVAGRGELVPAKEAAVVDTVGAGDAFNGALAVALAEGSGFIEACRFACRAAAIAVTRPGGIAGMPFRHEVEG